MTTSLIGCNSLVYSPLNCDSITVLTISIHFRFVDTAKFAAEAQVGTCIPQLLGQFLITSKELWFYFVVRHGSMKALAELDPFVALHFSYSRMYHLS